MSVSSTTLVALQREIAALRRESDALRNELYTRMNERNTERIATTTAQFMATETTRKYLADHLSGEIAKTLPTQFATFFDTSKWMTEVDILAKKKQAEIIAEFIKASEEKGNALAKRMLDEGKGGLLYEAAKEVAEDRMSELETVVNLKLNEVTKSYEEKVGRISELELQNERLQFRMNVMAVGGFLLTTVCGAMCYYGLSRR